MNFLLVIIIFLSIFSCSQKKDVLLVKQWHLSPGVDTSDVEKSKALGPYENQKDIFLHLENLIETKQINLIVSEGCEGEIDQNFKTTFHSWNLDNLRAQIDNKNFADIMAPIPLKLKAKYPELKVLCGDNDKLIKDNLRAFSDIKGFLGFYNRLIEAKSKSQEKYYLYLDKLQELFSEFEIKAPIKFTLRKATEALSEFEMLIYKRNDSFLNAISSAKQDKIAVIIGGLHVDDLKSKLKNFKVEVYEPKGYRDDEQALLRTLKDNLNTKMKTRIIYNQVPAGFSLSKFSTRNLISVDKVFLPEELKDIQEKLSDSEFKLLLGDFDNDGIRDFTFASSGEKYIMTAEDTDWDNDGIDNLNDSSLGEIQGLALLPPVQVSNNYLSQKKIEIVTKEIKKNGVNLLSNEEIKHELLVLEIFNVLYDKKLITKHQIKNVKAQKQLFSYGANVFFSYVAHTNTLEYYPLKLATYIDNQYKKRFKDTDHKRYINSYVIPLIIHSLAHEVAHSLDFDIDSYAKKFSWTWDTSKYNGKYLNQFRHSKKVINHIDMNKKYLGSTDKQWRAEHRKFLNFSNQFHRVVGKKERMKFLNKSEFFVPSAGARFDQQISFLYPKSIPSLYALKNQDEWFAEIYALCVFSKVYPDSANKIRSIELEHLLGINPHSSLAHCPTLLPK